VSEGVPGEVNAEFAADSPEVVLLDRRGIILPQRERAGEPVQAFVAGSDQGVLRGLQKLFHAGYLDRLLPLHSKNGGSVKMVYAITNRGVRALEAHGKPKSAASTDWSAKNRSLHDLSIRHALLVSHVRAVIELAAHSCLGLRRLFWKEGCDLRDAVEVALPEGFRRVPVAPDAYFALEDGRGECISSWKRRGTMTLKRLAAKLKAYARLGAYL
jgi:protein involved in plasmid replication-relaxation